jgi:hypothetical protein
MGAVVSKCSHGNDSAIYRAVISGAVNKWVSSGFSSDAGSTVGRLGAKKLILEKVQR